MDLRHNLFPRLRRIPAGRIASYTEIAQHVGAPRAVRAVARACATNGIAAGIPCHRVVRTDGALSGDRWGVAGKRLLLEREAAS
jgi:AraC family transcriptional regulator of adaptative response/methylated-DNA-[protein]-cysteine methyltransferase